ncbi:hypothetical protein REPUB_Repub11eG0129300 [Reevesia pubescens]
MTRESNYYTELQSELDSVSLISYTSLKDLIPSRKGSKKNPYSKGSTIQFAYEILITNLLVKKAAWVNLQPMAAALPHDSSNSNPREHILYLAWGDVKSLVKACCRFIKRNIINKIANAFEKLLGEIHGDNMLGSN